MTYVRTAGTLLGILIGCISVFTLLTVPSTTSAQLADSVDTSYLITLSQTPDNPAPNSVVSYSLTSGFIPLSSANISWYVDGTLVSSDIGNTTFTTTSGKSGSSHVVKVTVVGEDGLTSSSEARLHPSAVYILYEARTYTPPLFFGRALPSSGAQVLLHAETTDGNPDKTEYTWSIDGSRAPGLSGVGKQTITLTMPQYTGMTVSVSTRNAVENTSGSATVRLNPTEPLLLLYPHDPVTGIRYANALTTVASVRAEWSTVRLEPYYTPTVFSGGDFGYRWVVSGETANNASQEMDLPADSQSSLSASVLRNNKTISNAKETWNITVLPQGGGGVFTPTQ